MKFFNFFKRKVHMIELSDTDRMYIKITKHHHRDKYPFTGDWLETFKPFFEETYLWSPDDDYRGYVNGLFSDLLAIFIKIREYKYEDDYLVRHLTEIFNSSFYPSIYNLASSGDRTPVEHAVAKLAGLIGNNRVLNSDGSMRYDLHVSEEEGQPVLV